MFLLVIVMVGGIGGDVRLASHVSCIKRACAFANIIYNNINNNNNNNRECCVFILYFNSLLVR